MRRDLFDAVEAGTVTLDADAVEAVRRLVAGS
jgi:hypothetical protein